MFKLFNSLVYVFFGKRPPRPQPSAEELAEMERRALGYFRYEHKVGR